MILNPNCSELVVDTGIKFDEEDQLEELIDYLKSNLDVEVEEETSDYRILEERTSYIIKKGGEQITLSKLTIGDYSETYKVVTDDYDRKKFPLLEQVSSVLDKPVRGWDGGDIRKFETWKENKEDGNTEKTEC